MSKINKSDLSEEQLTEQNYRKYSGEKMDIFYNKEKCQHAAKCVQGNPDVFKVGRRPWIITDNGTIAENEHVLNQCPTGALKYLLKEN